MTLSPAKCRKARPTKNGSYRHRVSAGWRHFFWCPCSVASADDLSYLPAVRLPTLLMRLIEPAQVYFDEVDGGRSRSVPRRPVPVRRLSQRSDETAGKSYGLDAGDSAPAPELSRDRLFVDLATGRDAMRERFGDRLLEAARGLVESGHARVDTPGAALDARLVTFWRGDGVLEVQRSSATSSGTSRTRIERERLRDEEMFADYLAARLAQAIGSSG